MIKALNITIPSENALVFFVCFFVAVAVVVFFLCFGFGLGIWGFFFGGKNTSHEIYILNIF